jgi:UPF0755 protein
MRRLLLIAAGLVLFACSRSGGPRGLVTVNIRPGMSLAELTDTLANRGIIHNRLRFNIVAWRNDYGRRIVPGRYRLRTFSNERHVLRVLAHEEPALLMVTIPEGLTTNQTAARLAASGICDSARFAAACADTTVLRRSGITATSTEGYLFPETYELSTEMSPAQVVAALLHQFRRVYDSLVGSGSAGSSLGVRTSDLTVVTLASIVEREARAPTEYPVIAGVFANRLHRGMPLQSCATVEYALREHKQRLTDDDLRTDSPYNTYIHAGLPPGPICSPGRRALAAALNPARHDYLYFVSRGDGSHVFSRTFAEHSAAMRRLGL